MPVGSFLVRIVKKLCHLCSLQVPIGLCGEPLCRVFVLVWLIERKGGKREREQRMGIACRCRRRRLPRRQNKTRPIHCPDGPLDGLVCFVV